MVGILVVLRICVDLPHVCGGLDVGDELNPRRIRSSGVKV